MEDKKFAVLIDGDNTSSKFIKTIVNELTKEGVITYKRIYGDWTKPNLSAWKDVMLEYSLTPMQQYAYTNGKNATDSAMIIDAMDILYTGNVDGFCLVSSDSDFTRLAARLRESGMTVIGMGRQQTPKPFVSACSMFKYIDLISENEQPSGEVKQLKITVEEQPEATVTPRDEICAQIDNMIEEDADAEGYLLASKVGTMLQKKFSDFDCRNFGYKKPIEFLKSLGYGTKLADDKTTYYICKKAPKTVKTVKSVKKSASKGGTRSKNGGYAN